MNQFQIANQLIGDQQPVFIIAEAGVNHNGDFVKAKQLVDIAVMSGANAVKFQTFCTDQLVTGESSKAQYQIETTGINENQYEMLSKLELSFEQQRELKAYCDNKGIIFLSTPFDEKSFEFLQTLDLPAYKISSTDTNNYLFIKKIAKTQKPIVLSTGMSTFSEIEEAVHTIRREGNQQIGLLHCTSSYPTPPNECNLKVIQTFATCFDVIVGYSDHTANIGAGPFTVPLGAKIIEKHFTIDKKLEGPDHKASLDPNELKEYICQIRLVEQMMGSTEKQLTHREHDTRAKLQKKLFVNETIASGEVIRESVLTGRRSDKGIPVKYASMFIGKTTRRGLQDGDAVSFQDVDMGELL